MPLLYCRHCFTLGENNNVVDPTICMNTNPNIDRLYIATQIYDDIDVYFSDIERDNYYPALYMGLKMQDLQEQIWA